MKIKLPVFCAVIGVIVSVIFWLFLFAIKWGTGLIWDVLPQQFTRSSVYPLLVCTAGGLIIGLIRRAVGDYPEDMMTVFGKLRADKTYPYRKLPMLFICALLPLIFGSSVGPEAGMVGLIVALCCWAGDSMKFAKSKSEYYSRLGAEVTLSILFRSPLFGLFDVEGDVSEAGMAEDEKEAAGALKIVLYCIAAGAAFGMFWLMNTLFGKVSEGFPAFEPADAQRADYMLFVVYLICGIILGLFFERSERVFDMVSRRLPPVIKEVTAGFILGAVACVLPVIRFSGEEQMGILIEDYAKYAPLAMIGIAFLKIIMTNMCISLGLKGGHFFPLIFSAVCMGFGVSLMIFPQDVSHAT
ncbi:MAG: chloride channel protein, partial [Lachnospiraceae bacterium]|nr:chloride channel protein [Lachnospiraceae bacterium]